MPYAILGFLIPRHELAEWLKRQHVRQLRTNSDAMVLTKAGLDECRKRIEAGRSTSTTSTNVSTTDVAVTRNHILYGRAAASPTAKFSECSFEIKSSAPKING